MPGHFIRWLRVPSIVEVEHRPALGSFELEADYDPNLDRKLDAITAGALPHVKQHLLTKISRVNCNVIVDYISALQVEVGPSESYRISTIHALKHFAEFHKPKTFAEMTRQDVVDFLDSLRKPESVDTLHKWIGTYGFYRIILMRFFRWLYAPDLPQRNRPRPPIMENPRSCTDGCIILV